MTYYTGYTAYTMYPAEYGQLVLPDPRNEVDPHTDTCGWCEIVGYFDEDDKVFINRNCDEHGYLIDWEPDDACIS